MITATAASTQLVVRKGSPQDLEKVATLFRDQLGGELHLRLIDDALRNCPSAVATVGE